MNRISYLKLILVIIMIISSSGCNAEGSPIVTSYNVQTEASPLPESISESVSEITSAETSAAQTEETALSSDIQTEETTSPEVSSSESISVYDELFEKELLLREEASRKIFESLTERGADFVPYGEGYNHNPLISEMPALISDIRKTDRTNSSKEALINLLIRDDFCMSIFYFDELDTSDGRLEVYPVGTEYFENFSDFSDFIYETYTEECAYALINEFVLPPDQYVGKMFWEEDGVFLGKKQGLTPAGGKTLSDKYIEITDETDAAVEFVLWAFKEYGGAPYGIKSTAVKTDKGLRLTEMVCADPRNNKQYLDEQ